MDVLHEIFAGILDEFDEEELQPRRVQRSMFLALWLGYEARRALGLTEKSNNHSRALSEARARAPERAVRGTEKTAGIRMFLPATNEH
ncbi:hypothetical protein Pcinc_019381 [Petrolisthes cinctipes]|uniref:Uncharacterized protein n=1 Tax=Petrolisthes cinctipes TaxID=88211 RepID=A0AAE1FK62_PETCI|nr:hypothetical protein Pcinc_019381 [Petrolisthes cinctipes]